MSSNQLAISDSLIFYVNGKKIVEKNADPETTLLTYLRNNLRLTGSKLGCGEGGCGACTVMISKWDGRNGKPRHFAVNACLAPLVSVNKCAVTTVEGIGSTKTKLHEIQERLAKFHGSQCGFCTPGIVMSMYALLRNKQIPSLKDIDTCMQGNLCRCTGYRPIIAGFETFTCAMGKNCCKIDKKIKPTEQQIEAEHTDTKWQAYDDSQEPIFPPELMLSGKLKSSFRSLKYVGENVTWHQPTNLQQLLLLKNEHPEAKIVVGNTEVGIEMHIKGRNYSQIISPTNVKELNCMEEIDEGVSIGAACSLSDVEQFLKSVSKKRRKQETQVICSILEMLELFAGMQIRNVACIGGNIMTASPISDLNPILLAVGAKLTFASSSSGLREIQMDENFFIGYRKTNTRKDEILISIKIPFLTEDDVMKAFKQSKRKEDDIAIVNSAMHVAFEPGTKTIKKLSIAFGGMAAITNAAKQTMKRVVGRSWDERLLHDVCSWLNEEMKLSLDAPGGMVRYRRALVTSFFFKFYHYTLEALLENGVVQVENINISREIIGDLTAENEQFTSTQTWQEVPEDQDTYDTIGRPIPHLSGLKQVTGEAQYIDDIPPYREELHMVLVYSTRAHAKIINVDPTPALEYTGVVSFVDKNDVIGKNDLGMYGEVFADGKVSCVGHVIGAIVADTQAHAIKASRMVKITYEDILPRIITIDDAILHNSFSSTIKLNKGNAEEEFKNCDNVIEDEARVGGQEHFYMETQCCIAIPKNEDGEMEVFSSCQHPTGLQSMAATCLGVQRNKVTVRTKRLGGGFGGKESRFGVISNPAVTAARKLGKPIRCVLTRQEDMQITGGRHPFLAKYKIGFDNDGRIKALKIDLYSNGGNSDDLSYGVMTRAVTHADNCYNVPHMEVTGRICRTNIASNTAFRGFGGPQSMIISESWITKVAETLNMDPEMVRAFNMYTDGDKVLHGSILKQFKAKRCWEECLDKSNFHNTQKEIREFNKTSRWKKRGIACIPSKYSVGFGLKHLNQGCALVLIYTDGTVLLSHGGTEMGQGLDTKMVQVASRSLGVPIDIIHISECSTSSVPNASPTAASTSSDINGMAIKEACDKIMSRLQPLRKSHPNITWVELINKAYMERISLSATGFYRTPGLTDEWNHKTGTVSGDMFSYLAYGAAVSQVEIDVLTGHHVVLKTDLVVDVGNSLNPAIDVGQIEGAFAQGYGLVTLEEMLHSPSGHLWTVGPGAYKIPGFANTPKHFNVHLLRSCPNEKAIYSSKAVGEPPLFLASSVLYAIKDAIKSARVDAGMTGAFRLDSPATAERIRLACEDDFVRKAKPTEDENGLQAWAVRA
ncbi:xanthine dehydrogenase/oxidase-like isoform X1 [Styela clava]